MALLKFISLSVGSLMLLQGAYADGETAVDQSVPCLEVINKARSEVGLPNFGSIKDDKNYLNNDNSKTKFLPELCNVLKEGKPVVISPKTEESFNGATAAYTIKTQDCSAAVDEWKKGFSAIKNDNSTLPAAFGLDTTSKTAGAGKFIYGNAPYNALDAVNFVALYSGAKDATAECAVVTCAAETLKEKALVCMTYPTALTDQNSPYTQTQWDNILKVFAPAASSASAAVPTVLALAAAAVGVALM